MAQPNIQQSTNPGVLTGGSFGIEVIDSTGSTGAEGQVLTADGTGSTTWEDSGGSGGLAGVTYDLETLTLELQAGTTDQYVSIVPSATDSTLVLRTGTTDSLTYLELAYQNTTLSAESQVMLQANGGEIEIDGSGVAITGTRIPVSGARGITLVSGGTTDSLVALQTDAANPIAFFGVPGATQPAHVAALTTANTSADIISTLNSINSKLTALGLLAAS